MISSVDKWILERLERQPIILVGAGQLGEMALDIWPTDLPRPDLVLDSYKSGMCRDVPIAQLHGHEPVPGATYLLSAFKLPANTVKQIFGQLRQSEILTVYDLFERYCPEQFSNGWRCLDPSPEKLAKIDTVRKLFVDEPSLKVFDAAISWRYRRCLLDNFECEPEATKYNLLRYPEHHTNYDVVIDGGAYDLSFAGYLAAQGIGVGHYVAFEPDDQSFRRCVAALSVALPMTPRSLAVEKRALSDSCNEMPFQANGLLSARLLSTNPSSEAVHSASLVETITLDEYISKRMDSLSGRVLIKLHIEGGELAALRGSTAMLAIRAPDLFVNLSHDEQSLLEIPLLLSKQPGYRLFLTGHSLFGEGLTLFASAANNGKDRG